MFSVKSGAAQQLGPVEQQVLEDLGRDHRQPDHRRRDEDQRRPAAGGRDAAEQQDADREAADADRAQQPPGRLLRPQRRRRAAGEGGLVEALAPLGLDRERVDHQQTPKASAA